MDKVLIDGDLFCYMYGVAMTQENPFDSNHEKIFAEKEAIKRLENNFIAWNKYFTGNYDKKNIEVYFSCPITNNFRRKLNPDYKKNRPLEKPICFTILKDYCLDNYWCQVGENIEADDLLSIRATYFSYGKSLIVSIDKDFLSVPAYLFNPSKNILKKQTKEGAFQSLCYQIMVGDSADNYPGIPGIGPKKASSFIKQNFNSNNNSLWENMVDLAEKQGITPENLLSQARMAYLLQYGDYDFETKTIQNLFSPFNTNNE